MLALISNADFKKILFILFFINLTFLSFKSYAHNKKNENVYMVHIFPGPKWSDSKKYRQQTDINKHVFFMKNLFNTKKISYVISSIDGENHYYVMKGFKNKSDLNSQLYKSVLIKNKTLTFTVEPSILHMKIHHH